MRKITSIILALVLPVILAACSSNSSPANNAEKTGSQSGDAVNNSLAAKENFVLIKGGSFLMGSPENEIRREKDETQHSATVGDFYLNKYQVTQEEYMEIMGSNPSDFVGDNLPVENVTWYQAIEYCNARSAKEGLLPVYTIRGSGDELTVSWEQTANGYRLPTEAEWEYACRAQTTTPFNTGDNVTTSQANYYGSYPYNNNPRGEYRQRILPVGSFEPNAWGLYNMHGNVWEWCWDFYGDYPAQTASNYAGPAEGTYRVNRGGGWNDFGRHLRSAYRAAQPPVNSTFNIGFRVALNV